MALTTGLWDPLSTATTAWNDPWMNDFFTMPMTTGAGLGGDRWGRRYRAMPIDVIEVRCQVPAE